MTSAVPNRYSLAVGVGTPVAHRLDPADRPTSGTSPAASYTSDQDGRLTARPGQTMAWDHLGRLAAVTTAAGTTTYTYDPLDRLRRVTAPGGVVTRLRLIDGEIRW